MRKHGAHLFGWVIVAVLISAGAAQGLSGSNTVDSGDIKNGQVKAADLAKNAVTNTKIASKAVSNSKIGDKAVSTGKLADKAVTGDKLAANSITAIKIAPATITREEIDDETITSNEVKDGSLQADDIAVGTLAYRSTATTGNILDGLTLPVTATCDAGDVAIGGSFDQGIVANLVIVSSNQNSGNSSKWTVTAKNPTAASHSLTVAALCLNLSN